MDGSGKPWSAQELRCGAQELQPLPVQLRAGPLTCRYEEGDLRDLRVAGVPLVQRLYVGVRDHHWATIPGIISGAEIEVRSRSFRIAYAARHRQDEIDIERRMVLTGTDDGTVCCRMEGEVLRDFRSNRLGFCVLHPTPACAGTALTIVHGDGQREAGHFPRAIAPQTPFTDIAAIELAVGPSCAALISFSGEVFEMEDQRNYGDSSFKTYSTPQARPKPAQRRQGERIHQEVRISLRGAPPAAPAPEPITRITLGDLAGPPLPRLGLACPAEGGGALSAGQRALLAALRPAHLRVTLAPGAGAEARFTAAAAEAAALGCALEVAVVAAPEALGELPALAGLARRLRAPVRAWLVLPADGGTTGAALIAAARSALGGASEGAVIGGGALGHVLSLTARPPAPEVEEIAFPLHPQVHASDTSTLFDNIAAQAEILRDLRARCPGARFSPGPLTLAPPSGGEEPRQRALVAAAWTCASIGVLAAAGAERGTWHELQGRLGILPAGIPGGPAAVAVHPLWHLLAGLADMAGAPSLPLAISAPERVAALALRQPQRTRVWLANLTAEDQQVDLRGLDRDLTLWMLDETSAARAMREPHVWRATSACPLPAGAGAHALSLRPYALAMLEGAGRPG